MKHRAFGEWEMAGARRAALVVTAAVLAAGMMTAARPASAQGAGKYRVAGIDRDASVGAFLRALQTAVAHHDRDAVASMVAYPLVTRVHGQKQRIAGPREFVRRYPWIFDARVKKAVAAQREKDLFVNWRGVMIGNGEVWFALPDGETRLKITAVNH